jgi:2-C-methyl-D-erythritol 2,4-cyclodiphosphate synthase
MLVGIGFDIHKHSEDSELYLAGLKLDGIGFEAHSDGDIILHALCDALLGAVGKKDIGYYFPSNSNTPENISSLKILEKVLAVIEYPSLKIINIDIIFISQAINVSKIRDKIVENLATLLDINSSKINIKGKTTDNLGIIGNESASSCQAIISLTNA